MESKEFQYTSPEKNPLEYLREFIRSAPERVEREYAKPTTNSWVACFNSILMVLSGRMQFHKEKLSEILSPEQYQLAEEKLQKLSKRAQELLEKYPKRETSPPEEIKQELFEQVDIFK